MGEIILVDNYVSVKPGDAIRLLPFGSLVKNGKKREITAELASRFSLPHFKPPIKLGSHKDETPSGGSIVGLEVREDGLYAVTEFTEKGAQAVADGAYRYHSPEIIWDGFLEDPSSGSEIGGPLIVGTALLHTPHLGEKAALFVSESHNKDKGASEVMSENNITMPAEFFQSFFGKLLGRDVKPEEPIEPAPVQETETQRADYAAIAQERDDLAAQIQTLKAEKEAGERIQHFTAELSETPLAELEGAGAVLASMDDKQAEWVVTQFKALGAQIKESELTADLGTTGEQEAGGLSGAAKFDAAVSAVMKEKGVEYGAALQEVINAQPSVYAEYQAELRGK